MAQYSDTGTLQAVADAVADVAKSVTLFKKVHNLGDTPEKLLQAELPTIVQVLMGISQVPSSGNKDNGTHTVSLVFRMIIAVEPRVANKLGWNLKKTLSVVDAYFNAMRALGGNIAQVAIRPSMSPGGPLGVVKYAGEDFNGTEFTITATIYPD